LHKFHWTPEKYNNLTDEEKIFVHGSIQLRIKREKEEEAKLKAKRNKKR